MRKLYLAVAVVVIANISVPASAMSPSECAQLRKQIQTVKFNARGGFQADPRYQTARAAEEAARDEMVRNGCNRRGNAGSEICRLLIARVTEAAARTRAVQGLMREGVQPGYAGQELQLTARYDAECRNQAARQRQQRAAEEAAVAGAIALGIGILGGAIANGPRGGPRTPGHPR